MIKLKAPALTPAQKKQVVEAKTALESVLESLDSICKKISNLRKKEHELRGEAEQLDRKAKNFDREADKELTAVSKQIERVTEAIETSESQASSGAEPLFTCIEQGQELVSRLCQKTHDELLDVQAKAMKPFWPDYNEARQIGRTSTAVQNMVTQLLRHSAGPNSQLDQTYEVAKDILRKLDALLNHSVIWEFEGCENNGG